MPPASNNLSALVGKLQAEKAALVDWTERPAEWLEERLQTDLWSKQKEICAALVDHDRVAVRAAHSVGKSFLAARLALWWITSHPPGSAFVVSTAPTFPQVRAILWREMNRGHKLGNLPGKMNQVEWRVNDELVAMGRKPADHDEYGFQGIHAEYVLAIIDEAGGVPKGMWDAVETIATGSGCKILAIGNPDDPSSHFRANCELESGVPGIGMSRNGWYTLRISAFDSPNFTGEPINEGAQRALVSEKWVDQKRKSWGEGSPLWQAKIEAEFPDSTADSVVPWADVLACRRLDGALDYANDPVVIGVDVGGGTDETVCIERKGLRVGRVWRQKTADPRMALELVLRAAGEVKPDRIVIDSMGVGWSLVGWVRERLPNVEVKALNVSTKANDDERFRTVRDEMWWNGRERCIARGWDLSALAEDDLIQLCDPRWSPGPGGKIVVEPKTETRKRLGRSPDIADALLLAFYEVTHAPGTQAFGWAGRLAAARAA